MESQTQSLHILFFPFMAPGHMIPMVNMAKIFAKRGIRATIVTTPANAPFIRPSIDRATIQLALIPFPSASVGLPDGCENFSSLANDDLQPNFLQGVDMLRQPFEQILEELLPDAIVTDSFFPWTLDAAMALGVPRLVFSGTGFFPRCVNDALNEDKPHENLPAGTESFVLPGLPHRIELLRAQVPDPGQFEPIWLEIMMKAKESLTRSFGMVVNSFYELEPEYVDHYRTVTGRRAWHIGPVSLHNERVADKASIGDDHECLDWLDEQQPNSVLYVCFGSLCEFTADQLREIALGLEASGHPFVWAPGKSAGREDNNWMPEGYSEKIQGKGFVVRRWAPQVLILNHVAVGGFLTHCGWNSIMEGVSAGLPLIAWPLYAEQFFNEKLIVNVLKIGVAVGIEEYAVKQADRPVVAARRIEEVVREMMAGEEGGRMRTKARELGEMAKRAVEEGGSSYVDMGNLIKEIIDNRKIRE